VGKGGLTTVYYKNNKSTHTFFPIIVGIQCNTLLMVNNKMMFVVDL